MNRQDTIAMSQQQPARKQESTQFFRNYNRLVGATYLAILLLTVALFLYQIVQKQREEVQTIGGHVARHGQFIEFILRSSLDSLESMRIAASESFRLAGPGPGAGAQSPLFPLLQEAADGFNLDAAPERDATGNVTGTGALAGRSPAFYSDLRMALGLGPVFQAIALHLPNAASAGFISREHFSDVYPWVEHRKRPFSDSVYSSPTWTMGTPQQNRNREKYWPPVYYAGPENGLLVPTAAPIYNRDEFRGVVSIETSLDYLNRINSDFGYKPGTVFLVDAYGEVLAHPGLFADALRVQSTRPVAQVMPAGILDRQRGLAAIPADTPTEIAGHLVVRHAFVSAPWQLVYVVPTREIWSALLWERGPLMLMVVLGLTLLMVVTYLVTTREFIAPASKLVSHIAAESQFKPAPIPPVPGTWRPWFETISQAFRESLQLVGIRQELDIAAKMQLAILPRHWPDREEFSLWGLMRSAKEVGGDFYDHFPLEGGQIGIVVADVSGKGVPAALFGMVSKTLVRATATRFKGGPGEAIASVNDILCEDNDTCIFVTTFYGVYEPESGQLTYVNAGHPAPLLVHADGSSEFLPMTGGTALGIMDGIPFAQRVVTLQPGDCLLMYSDGVTEAFSPQAEEFTPARLLPLFAAGGIKDVHAAVRTVVAAVDAHANGAPQSDDITCVALIRRVGAPAPAPAHRAAETAEQA
ncbi:SpoIIE family protein phosphatase [Caenimonas terrae]|uniref:SpoIIE family protein phosphatase n=1 Tax=Caenimonas terrae TaxID=696074 RepID=A0ABW0NDX0_9BURK